MVYVRLKRRKDRGTYVPCVLEASCVQFRTTQ